MPFADDGASMFVHRHIMMFPAAAIGVLLGPTARPTLTFAVLIPSLFLMLSLYKRYIFGTVPAAVKYN